MRTSTVEMATPISYEGFDEPGIGWHGEWRPYWEYDDPFAAPDELPEY